MGLQYIIIRPFNLIGVRQKSESGMVVPSFVKSALESNTINIYGNGQQSRTFSDVKTAVKLFWELINKKILTTKFIILPQQKIQSQF
ncbi:MAG: NAD-dependent epimerase/dehydratase family protein [Ignavibacteriaceae bacterium]|nr:NAD-dependent epimerase/dehydratase family protein [Ignavibacteriaceae bacterium]